MVATGLFSFNSSASLAVSPRQCRQGSGVFGQARARQDVVEELRRAAGAIGLVHDVHQQTKRLLDGPAVDATVHGHASVREAAVISAASAGAKFLVGKHD